MNKYVITGPPHSGKTTLINYIREKGHKVIPESARYVLEKTSVKEMLFKSQKDMIDLQYSLEHIIKGEEVFLDRGMIDYEGYSKHYNTLLDWDSRTKISASRYDKVFYLDSIEPYEMDGTRFENRENGRDTFRTIHDCYTKRGMRPEPIPFTSVEDQYNFILGRINERQ